MKGNHLSTTSYLSNASAISGNGSVVAFESGSDNLDPADTDINRDIYIKNLTTGNLTLASTNDSGVKGNANSVIIGLSADGNVVLFDSGATNLDPGDTDIQGDVYAKNLATGDLTLVSASGDGTKANGQVDGMSITSDGSMASFDSYATNLVPEDTDTEKDVYIKDLRSGELTLADIGDAGKANFGAAHGMLSAQGTRIAFGSVATNLVPNSRRLGSSLIFVKNLITGEIVVGSTNDEGRGDRDTYSNDMPSLSDDGSRLAFMSVSTIMDPADRSTDQDVYVKELAPVFAVEADLSITNVDRRDPVRAGAAITYTLTIANAGPLSATGVTVTDRLPGSVTFVSATSLAGTCSEAAGVVTCTVAGSLVAGARPPTVRVVVTAQSPGIVSNTASVAGNEQDSNLANNQDTETTTVT
jgi:uncharacterized repeat protein (TIGR01451 family)